ncbi:hypothetical protein BCR37DRAFT_320876 [Protomyces lactucae-debilis]|uniref:Asl1-like glycosyl hydrolase catalytic domain-containing protein n=1 Tax=Protomyces lactucae-debilis TaxID=2754530 RepID=A0A1Y2FFL8_PROLT|nr:uncharacterized protein BCR37DRAFT_320876 [Protomyces lactucae-debilis]ORY82711.1 hypothetical protein BCR37DRAFT_320876 [Protomyces lactucae-debilis]
MQISGNLLLSYLITTGFSVVAAPAIGTSGGRRGLGWDPSSPASSALKYIGNKVGWYFNWSPEPSAGMPGNWEFYANQWGSGDIQNLANRLQGRPKLIGFNEPDSATQAHLSPGAAILLYKQYLTGLKGQGKISQLGTPAITNSMQPGEGLSWLSQFMAGCGDCGLDFAVVHWYSTDFEDFKRHVTTAHEITGLPVNVAEFAYTSWQSSNEPSEAVVQDFMNKAVAWLEAQSFVSAYAWFGSMYVSEAKYPSLGAANSLITQDLNSLTSLGYSYAG